MDKIAYALNLAELGLRVFCLHYPILKNGTARCSCGDSECTSIGKHPIAEGWQESATTDAAAIRKEWRTHPSANVGVATGCLIDVLDVDGKAGECSLAGLEASQGKLPDTWRVRTGSGKLHIYFRATSRLKNAVRFAPGLDIRTSGGLVVGVGSLHAEGGTYEWEPDYSPEQCELADMPEWLISEITACEPQSGSSATAHARPDSGWTAPHEPYSVPDYWLDHYLSLAEDGTRNDTGFRLAQQLLDNAYQFDPTPERERQLLNVMMEFARQCPDGKGAYTAREARRSFYSALNGRRRDGFREPAGPGDTIAGLVHGSAQGAESEEQGLLKTVSLQELLAQPPEPARWCVDRLFPQVGVAMLAGESGVGKSWLLYHLALCVGSGQSFLGNFTTRRGSVLYVDLENGRPRTHRRIAKLAAGVDWTEVAVDFAFGSAIRLDRPDAARRFATEVEQWKPSLLIIDSLRRAHQGDENDSALANAVGSNLHRLAEELGMCIVVCHHFRKESALSPNRGAERVRGSSDWRAVVDGLLTIGPKRPGIVSVGHVKSRDCEELDDFLVELDLGDDDAPAAIKYIGAIKPDEKRQDVADRIVSLLRDSGGALRKDILAFAGEWEASQATVRRALDELLKSGAITKDPNHRGKADRFIISGDSLLGQVLTAFPGSSIEGTKERTIK